MTAIALKSLPLGFRFHPKDEELVNHYLKNKMTGRIKSEVEVIPEIDVCKCEPWELPEKSLIKSEDPEWFFFAPKDRKYPSGHRSNRATKHGYWKATGRDRVIRSSGGKGSVIGMKKTLVFHEGRAPKGVRTYWIMHEYRTTEPEFESGDKGSYVLYRLFNKKPEDKSPTSNTEDMEIFGFSPDGTQNGKDGVEEIELHSNHESPSSDLQEEPMPNPDSFQKQLAGIEMWTADKGDSSTRVPVKPETDHGDMFFHDEETKLGGKADSLQNVLSQLCDGVDEQIGHGFSNFSSPMLQFSENPSISDMNQEFPIGSNPFDNVDLDAFLNSVLESDDCSSGACNFPKDSRTDSLAKDPASCKDSGSNSEVEIEPCLTQGATSQWFHGPFLGPNDLLPMDGSYIYPESPTQLSALYENASLLPYDITGPDVYSVDTSAESLEDLFNSIEDSNNLNKLSGTMEDVEITGIKIRSRLPPHPEPNSSNSFSRQGIAGRLQLQASIRNVQPTGVDTEIKIGIEDKNSTPKATQTLCGSIEESSSDKSIADKFDESLETGIKVRARQVEYSPNLNPPEDKVSGCEYVYGLQAASDSESHKDNNKDEVENIEQHAGEHLVDKISEAKENNLPTFLKELSIHDADETTSSSRNCQQPESVLRFRKKSPNEVGKSVKQSSSSMQSTNLSAGAYVIYLVLSVVVLLLVLQIYRLMNFTDE